MYVDRPPCGRLLDNAKYLLRVVKINVIFDEVNYSFDEKSNIFERRRKLNIFFFVPAEMNPASPVRSVNSTNRGETKRHLTGGRNKYYYVG